MAKFRTRCAFMSAMGVLCSLYFASGASIPETPSTLQMIAAVFRHGDRAPTLVYPKDPYYNYEWHGGLGALSQKGVRQTHELGKKLRKRYSELLPENGLYTKEAITVVSSYSERCLTSAKALLAGFMPPLPDKDPLLLNWQPVPVSFPPPNMEQLLTQDTLCKKYDEEMEALQKNPPADLKALISQNQDLFLLLTKHTKKNVSTPADIRALYDTLLVEKQNGLELPDWTEKVFPERMIPFAERYNTFLTETTLMKKVKGGPIITEIFNNMMKKQNNTLEPNRKIFLYSAREHSLASIANSLNIIAQTARLHDYASMIVFELHTKVNKNDDEVKIFYYPNSEVEVPQKVTIPCARPCSLENFKKYISNLIVDNFDKICENSKSKN